MVALYPLLQLCKKLYFYSHFFPTKKWGSPSSFLSYCKIRVSVAMVNHYVKKSFITCSLVDATIEANTDKDW